MAWLFYMRQTMLQILAAQFSGENISLDYTARLCELVLLPHRRTDSSYLIRLLQVRTVKDTLRKQGFQNPQPVGEGAVWVWLIQLLIEAMTTKSLM